MNEAEYAQLMQHTQTEMRRVGLGELVERISGTLETGEPPHAQLRRMLEALHRELQHHDLLTTQRIMDELARTVRTESGQPPDGMQLDLSPAHQNLYGVREVDLMQGAELTQVLSQLETLKGQLAEDPDLWQ
jgi:hypothetical protein